MEIVRLVEFIMLPNASGRHLWHTQIKSLLRSHFLKCPYMNNRRYGFKSIKWLLDREMTIRNFTTRELNGGMTQLHYACTLNKIWLVQACIAFNNKDDMTTPDDIGRTPLHMASINADADVVKLVLDSGAHQSLYHKDRDGNIPIDHAVGMESFHTARLLLSHHQKDKKLALENVVRVFWMAVIIQNLEFVKLVLAVLGPDIMLSHDVCGITSLHKSCSESDDTKVMEILLASGAKVNAVDTKGETPLFWTVYKGRPECAKVLLAAGATVNHRNTAGKTPVDIAIRNDKPILCELLKDAGGLVST